MRARPARSEARRLAAQLVAYGGRRAGSMREGTHPGRNAAFPAQLRWGSAAMAAPPALGHSPAQYPGRVPGNPTQTMQTGAMIQR
ncbi:hypothetical protein GCM10018773_08450 [Streptomyces candidus]|nr:hypothetical protein GCM10018773_08450 [Streptomyces candidus]